MSIPKIIHYCWFGRCALTPLSQKCIESWRRFFPNYDILEWNEDNFDVNIISYTSEAYKAGRFAFVSDYARFWVLYRYGGVYFDTDVEVIKPLDDILGKGPFMGFEQLAPSLAVAPGLGLAADPGMPIYKAILERYEGMSFFLPNGSLSPHTMIPMVTALLKEKGLKGDGTIERIDGINIYPSDWFNPFDDTTGRLLKTENTRTIHWYAKSWMDADPAWKTGLKRLARRIFGKDRVAKLGKMVRKG